MSLKRTKIVCTIGPASSSKSQLKKMMKAGMNVCRLNFSHGSYDDHAHMVDNIKKIADEIHKPIAILQDLQGPRIRVGALEEEVSAGKKDSILLYPENDAPKKIGKNKIVPIQYKKLYKDVRSGAIILIEDGKIKLKVKKVTGTAIHCSVVVPGVIKKNKGINVPGVTLTATVITEKDKRDVEFGVKQGVDYIALSFVKNAQNIKSLRKLIDKHHAGPGPKPGIIAKIERQEALHNFMEILDAVDGIMVARGDLGLEIDAEDVPVVQKDIITQCLIACKPVIVATQMLDSMIENLQPTRAEVSDVANAVIDHTDAVMLSGESAIGKYPVETVDLMGRICTETEKSEYDDLPCTVFATETLTDAFRESLCQIAASHSIRAICFFDDSGFHAQQFSCFRPEIDIIPFVNDKNIYRRLALLWGVYPVFTKLKPQVGVPRDTRARMRKLGIKKGEQVIFVTWNDNEVASIHVVTL